MQRRAPNIHYSDEVLDEDHVFEAGAYYVYPTYDEAAAIDISDCSESDANHSDGLHIYYAVNNTFVRKIDMSFMHDHRNILHVLKTSKSTDDLTDEQCKKIGAVIINYHESLLSKKSCNDLVIKLFAKYFALNKIGEDLIEKITLKCFAGFDAYSADREKIYNDVFERFLVYLDRFLGIYDKKNDTSLLSLLHYVILPSTETNEKNWALPRSLEARMRAHDQYYAFCRTGLMKAAIDKSKEPDAYQDPEVGLALALVLFKIILPALMSAYKYNLDQELYYEDIIWHLQNLFAPEKKTYPEFNSLLKHNALLQHCEFHFVKQIDFRLHVTPEDVAHTMDSITPCTQPVKLQCMADLASGIDDSRNVHHGFGLYEKQAPAGEHSAMVPTLGKRSFGT